MANALSLTNEDVRGVSDLFFGAQRKSADRKKWEIHVDKMVCSKVGELQNKNESKYDLQKALKLLVHPEYYFTKKEKNLKDLLLSYFIQMNNV